MSLNTSLALVTLPEAKDFLKKKDDDDLAVLEVLINSVGEFFRRKLGRTLISTVYTAELYDGNGWPDFWLPNFPVTLLTSVHEDGTLLTENTDFYAYLPSGRMRKASSGGYWTTNPKGIKVTYTAGYALASVPPDLKVAFLVQLSTLWEKFLHKSWGETSRSVGNQSVNLSEEEILPMVKTILGFYERKRT
jgi:hypothetical protein